jgi:hypothetical protein
VNIKSQKDFFSGLMFMGVGIAFAWGATKYSVGTAARMGPGYFPLLLGVLMAIIGAVITFKALVVKTADGDKIGAFAWRPLVYIIAANLVFGILLAGLPSIGLPAFGLIVGIYALVIIASMAEPDWQFKPTLVLATVLAVGSYLIFIKGLSLTFPVWPAFITG